jgi:glycosyltransferase involved in cell wall biosynthesis
MMNISLVVPVYNEEAIPILNGAEYVKTRNFHRRSGEMYRTSY